MTDRAEQNLTWGKLVALSLWEAGVRQVCISPGSRSTPLVLGLYLFRKIEIFIQVDERSAAFFALGMAKMQQRPVPLLCTSGSAVSHYFPAVIEAFYSHIPLVILSADRPNELRHCGAQQTIDQLHLFGRYVRSFVDVGLPSKNEQYLATIIQSTIGLSLRPIPGAVHLNFAFNEPLSPQELNHNFNQNIPIWKHLATKSQLNDIDLLLDIFQTKRKGVIIVGVNKKTITNPNLIHQLADILGYPLLVEATGMPRQNCISHYDSFLRSAKLADALQPEIVIRFGDMPTSKSYRQWLEKYPQCQQITIGSYENTDPTHGNNWQITMDITDFCLQLLDSMNDKNFLIDRDWCNQWQKVNYLTQKELEHWLNDIKYPFEGKIYYELAQKLPENTIIYIGNSTPIRDLDSYFHNSCNVIVFSNRGTNGIDGMISSAMGVAKISNQSVLLICGDLTFFHDLNGLLLGKLHDINITILLLDNSGGSIFEMLPISNLDPPFEELFATPIGIDFSSIVRGFGAEWIEVFTIPDVIDQILLSLQTKGVQVIGIKTDRKKDWQSRKEFWQRIILTLEESISQEGKTLPD